MNGPYDRTCKAEGNCHDRGEIMQARLCYNVVVKRLFMFPDREAI